MGVEKSEPVAKGEWNHLLVAIGRPGTGKSTWALKRASELGRRSYVLVYDPGYTMPVKLPRERKERLIRHETISDAIRAIEASGAGIHAVSDGSPVELLSAAEGLAARSLSAHGGASGFPVTVVIDEGVMLASGKKSNETKSKIRESISQRRHRHIGFIITCQHGFLLDYAISAMATEIAVFQCTGLHAKQALINAGIPDEMVEHAPNLKRFEKMEYRPGG